MPDETNETQTTTMLSLMEELTSTENKVSFSRQALRGIIFGILCLAVIGRVLPTS